MIALYYMLGQINTSDTVVWTSLHNLKVLTSKCPIPPPPRPRQKFSNFKAVVTWLEYYRNGLKPKIIKVQWLQIGWNWANQTYIRSWIVIGQYKELHISIYKKLFCYLKELHGKKVFRNQNGVMATNMGQTNFMAEA